MNRTLAGLAGVLFTAAALAQSAAKPAARPAAKPAPGAKSGESLEEVAVLETDAGTIVVRFFPQVAPNHVANFKDLVKSGFYTGTRFHRTVQGFMIQGGDPKTKDPARKSEWGSGDGPRMLKQEFNRVHHAPGILSMARATDPNSASCQFFIVHDKASFLDNQYTVFGQVVEGMGTVDKIATAPVERGPYDPEGSRPVNPVVIKAARLETRALPPAKALIDAGYLDAGGKPVAAGAPASAAN